MQTDLEKSRSEVAAQKWMNLADKEAINNFMTTVQELRSATIEKGSTILSLTLELEDVKQLYDSLQTSYEKKVCIVFPFVLNFFCNIYLKYIFVFVIDFYIFKVNNFESLFKFFICTNLFLQNVITEI